LLARCVFRPAREISGDLFLENKSPKTNGQSAAPCYTITIRNNQDQEAIMSDGESGALAPVEQKQVNFMMMN
jgi:hypothetical protein